VQTRYLMVVDFSRNLPLIPFELFTWLSCQYRVSPSSCHANVPDCVKFTQHLANVCKVG